MFVSVSVVVVVVVVVSLSLLLLLVVVLVVLLLVVVVVAIRSQCGAGTLWREPGKSACCYWISILQCVPNDCNHPATQCCFR